MMTLVLIGKVLVMAGLGGAMGYSFGKGKPVRGFIFAVLTVGMWIVLFLS